jgi:hypothetical protein
MRARARQNLAAAYCFQVSRQLGTRCGSVGRRPFVSAALAEARTASPMAFGLLPSAGESQPNNCNARTPSAVMSNWTTMQPSRLRRRHARIRSAEVDVTAIPLFQVHHDDQRDLSPRAGHRQIASDPAASFAPSWPGGASTARFQAAGVLGRLICRTRPGRPLWGRANG